jgi:hypothetical protein
LFYRTSDREQVYVVPGHVVKLESMDHGFSTRIVSITGSPEVVEGPPSEVNKRLRSGQ